MPNQTILIKPASGICNLNCQYCFYYDVMNHREVKSHGFMSLDTLEQIVKKAFEYADQFVAFAFQGGEPTLIGLPFYERFIEYVEKYNNTKIKVSFSLQTNGINIDQTWAIFFKQHRFLIGLSMDGPKEIHNLNRMDSSRNGTFHKVSKASQILAKEGVDVNVLCVVSKNIAKHPVSVYQYFMKNHFNYIQFIPCLDPLSEKPGTHKYSLLPEDYGQFLCEIFDQWYQDFKKGNHISIRMFDNILHILLGFPPESCDMNGQCSVNPVIEGDGAVYPCDFYVLDEWCLGNINEHGFEELKTHSAGQHFVDSSLQKEEECLSCEFLTICRTGCRRHKEPRIDAKPAMNYFCSSYKKFYLYTLPRFKEIAGIINRNIK
ncbi:MAG: anaerobic sulfatase maturase [Mobilitalea sp.]